jgi:hypothetical protein
MRKPPLLPFLALPALLVAGCSAPCLIETQPPGAQAFVDGELRGVTPCTLQLGNTPGDQWGWGITDHRTLLLVSQKGQFFYVRLNRTEVHGIPSWPEYVSHRFTAEDARAFKPTGQPIPQVPEDATP